MLLLHD